MSWRPDTSLDAAVEPLDWPVAHGCAAVVSAAGAVQLQVRKPADAHLPFALASVTKVFTSLAVLAAVRQGALELDAPVASNGATVRELLAHAGGQPGVGGVGAGERRRRRVYSNHGFRVVANATAHAVGTDFATWLAHSVLSPLGCTRTSLGSFAEVAEDPAAGVVAPVGDVVRLVRCLLAQGAPVLDGGLWSQMVQVQVAGLDGVVPGVGRFAPCDWGLGVELHGAKRPHWMGERRSSATFGHFGSSGCFVWVDPEVGIAAIGLSDRPFVDDGWAMQTWPGWSDALAASR